MLDVGLFRNLRFSAASGAVTIVFFSLMGFIFLVTLYFQFLKGYGPLSTGRAAAAGRDHGRHHLRRSAPAWRCAPAPSWSSPPDSSPWPRAWPGRRPRPTTTSYLTIAGQMVLIGSGIGLTGAPATESIMGAVPAAKAGVGSAVNDATRILGGTLGVAVIGSIYASIYSDRLTSALPAGLPGAAATSAEQSVGAAFGAAGQLHAAGEAGLAQTLTMPPQRRSLTDSRWRAWSRPGSPLRVRSWPRC